MQASFLGGPPPDHAVAFKPTHVRRSMVFDITGVVDLVPEVAMSDHRASQATMKTAANPLPTFVCVDVPGTIPMGRPGDEALRGLGGLDSIEKAFAGSNAWFDLYRSGVVRTDGISSDTAVTPPPFPSCSLSLTICPELGVSRSINTQSKNRGCGFVLKVRKRRSGKLEYSVAGRLIARASFVPEAGLADYHMISMPKNQDLLVPHLTDDSGRGHQRVEDDLGRFFATAGQREMRLREGVPLLDGGLPTLPEPGNVDVTDPFDEEISELRPPSMHSRLTRPFHYGFIDNPYQKNAKTSLQALWGRPRNADDESIPLAPGFRRAATEREGAPIWRTGVPIHQPLTKEELEVKMAKWCPLQKEYYQKVNKEFQDRPVCTTRLLGLRVKTTLPSDKMKPVLFTIAFTATAGPWRYTLIRRGYDPRLHVEARFYQIIGNGERMLSDRRLADQTESKDNDATLLRECTFNESPNNRLRYLQLCDIDLGVVQSLIRSLDPETVPSVRTGWFTASGLGQVRALMDTIARNRRLNVASKVPT